MSATPNPAPPAPSAFPFARFLFGALFAAAAWWLIRQGTRLAHTVDWECYGGECSTNDWEPILPIGGIACAVIAAVLLAKPLRAFGVGLVLMLAPLAAVAGWSAAVAEGAVTADSVLTGQRIWLAVAALGALVALLGLLHELRATGIGALLLGAKRTPATLTDFSPVDTDQGPVSAATAAQAGHGTATLAFTANGSRHRVRVRTHRSRLDQPVYAVYRESRPENARLGLPWIRRAIPVAAAVDTPPAPDSIVSELERLAALRAAGHLTQEEFEAAKRRLLG